MVNNKNLVKLKMLETRSLLRAKKNKKKIKFAANIERKRLKFMSLKTQINHSKLEYIEDKLVDNQKRVFKDSFLNKVSLNNKKIKTPNGNLRIEEKRFLPFLDYNKYYENIISQNYYIKNYFVSSVGIELETEIKDFFLFENLKNEDEIIDYVKSDNKLLPAIILKKKNFLFSGYSLNNKSFTFKFNKNQTVFFELNIPGINKKIKPSLFSFNKVLDSLDTFSKNINKFKAFLLLIKPQRNCFLCLYNGIIGNILTKELKNIMRAYRSIDTIEPNPHFLIRIPFLYINASFYSAYYKRRIGKRLFLKKALKPILKKKQILKKKRERNTIKFYFSLSDFSTEKVDLIDIDIDRKKKTNNVKRR